MENTTVKKAKKNMVKKAKQPMKVGCVLNV